MFHWLIFDFSSIFIFHRFLLFPTPEAKHWSTRSKALEHQKQSIGAPEAKHRRTSSKASEHQKQHLRYKFSYDMWNYFAWFHVMHWTKFLHLVWLIWAKWRASGTLWVNTDNFFICSRKCISCILSWLCGQYRFVTYPIWRCQNRIKVEFSRKLLSIKLETDSKFMRKLGSLLIPTRFTIE